MRLCKQYTDKLSYLFIYLLTYLCLWWRIYMATW